MCTGAWCLSASLQCYCELSFVALQPHTKSESGSCSNLITVHQSDFEVFDALASDGRAVTSDDSSTTSIIMLLFCESLLHRHNLNVV